MSFVFTIFLILVLFGGVMLFLGWGDLVDYVLQKEAEVKALYQGPILPGSDEDHFRKTGETIPLETNG